MLKPEPFLCLLLTWSFLQNSDCKHLPPECAHVSCLACPDNHKAVTIKGECCPRCIPPCSCPAFLEGECGEEGILILGESVYIDFGTRKCTCVSGGKIKCISTCPKIPPTCKYIGKPMDGCGVCACPTGNEHFVSAGETINEECKTCQCPEEGGQLQCKQIC